MKYTDTIFSFPIRVYDGFQVRKSMRKEEALIDDLEAPIEDDWITGIARIPISEIQAWFDYFTPGRKVSDVSETGFDSTVVMTNSLGDFVCMWDRKKFENKLDDFAKRHDDMIEAAVDEALAEKEAILRDREERLELLESNMLKKPWWKKIFHNIALNK